jgi:glycosyltransferase involved in cell wall biosynthesis
MVDASGWELPAYQLRELAPKRSGYAVVIPVINEGERIQRQLAKMRALTSIVDLIIVDGGSTDGSLGDEILRAAGVRAFAIKTGPGRLSAQLRIGLAWAMSEGYDGVVLIDGNDKDNSAAIPAFVDALRGGADHVQGSRYVPGGIAENTPLLRHLAVKFLHAPLISLAARHRYTDTTNGFRAYSRRFLLDERVRPFRDVFTGYELHYYLAIRAARLGFRVMELPVERRYPAGRVPTKIHGLAGYLALFRTLLAACFGAFDPENES